ncbi:MAG: N,N-dimethylformamidase beta subunit family domain-containing protein [Syntrophomonadaceae bacterium]
MKKIYRFISVIFFLAVLSASIGAQSTETKPNITDEPGFGCGLLEGGYASDLSAYKGDTLKFYISTHALQFDLKIYRYGRTKELVATIPQLTGGIHEVRQDDAVYKNGCGWPETARLVIPQDWKPGAYLAEFPVNNDSINPVLFFVKDSKTTNRLLVVCATNTYQAYNMFGGKSSYPAYSSEGGSGIWFNNSEKLSFFRPFNRNNHSKVNRGSFYAYDSKLIKWLEEEGYDADVVSDTDLDRDPTYLNKHKVLLLTGHNEYWSRKMRENVEAFLNLGGHFMCLSGNTCWWQIRYENNYHTFVCYKHNPSDPYFKTDNGTQEWYTIQRENNFLGTSYENGGQTNYLTCLPWQDGFGGFIVRNSQHWAYENTGLAEGDTLGYYADSSIVGYETDAALFKYKNGLPVVTGEDNTPLNFKLLGVSPANHTSANAPEEWATMGIFRYNKDRNPKAGYVFNAATVRWAWGLQSHSTTVSKMTKNILEHFLNNCFPPEFVSWWPHAAKAEWRLKTFMPFNYRKIEIQQGRRVNFRVSAVDENRQEISYSWTVNDTVQLSGDRYMKFDSREHINGRNIVKSFVYNSKDTSSITWEVNVIPGAENIKIASKPASFFTPGKEFSYVPGINSRKEALVHYRIDHMPDWMTFDASRNVFSGIPTPEAPMEDSISVAAVDNMGDIDYQAFVLRSASMTALTDNDQQPADFELFQNYPNPFNGMTKIRFYVKNPARAELIITNLQGQRLRTFKFEEVPKGYHDIMWDGKNESGNTVASGIYIYRITCTTAGADGFNMVKKMAYIK